MPIHIHTLPGVYKTILACDQHKLNSGRLSQINYIVYRLLMVGTKQLKKEKPIKAVVLEQKNVKLRRKWRQKHF